MTGTSINIDPTSGVEYRVVNGGDTAVVIMHGGHMSAHIALGEAVFRNLGYTVVVPSRPGYGSTPAHVDDGQSGFVDAVAGVVAHVGCRSVDAVVGISAGGPAAIEMAARQPALVRRLILENSVSSLRWPDPLTRVAGRIAFAPAVEAASWTVVRALLRRAPTLALRGLIGPLTTRPTRDVLEELDDADRVALTALFASMRSGQGFRQDLDAEIPASLLQSVTQPALILASKHDASVTIEHARDLHAHLAGSTLTMTDTSSHLMWFGPRSESIDAAINLFIDQTT